MRVLLLLDRYLPHPIAGAKLVHDNLGVEMARMGHEVAILSSTHLIRDRVQITTEDGMQVVRVRALPLKGTSRVLRAASEELLPSILWWGARDFFRANRFDLVVTYAPSIFLGRLAHRLKRLWGCHTHLILRDIFPQWAVDAGVLKKGLAWRFLRLRELQQYAAADVIAVQSPRNLEYFRQQVLPGRFETEVLYNWTALDEGEVPSADIRTRLGLSDEVIFFYGGNIGVAQDMDNVVRLAKALPRELRTVFLLLGEGTEVERLKRLVANERIANVRLLPAVSQREYLSVLRDVDVGLISLDRRLKTHNFPGKMLGYMYFAKPILASINHGNDLSGVMDEYQAGLWSLNGDDDKLCEQAVSLARSRATQTPRRKCPQVVGGTILRRGGG